MGIGFVEFLGEDDGVRRIGELSVFEVFEIDFWGEVEDEKRDDALEGLVELDEVFKVSWGGDV